MDYKFNLETTEMRAFDTEGKKQYIVKGYATVPNHAYAYKNINGRSFREYFSHKALENIKRKAQLRKIFVDVEHKETLPHSINAALEEAEYKTGVSLKEQKDFVSARMSFSDIPMFKLADLNIDDKGIFVEIHGNPFYRDVDNEHKVKFDAVWNSIQAKFINGISLHFSPISTTQIKEGLTQIDDVDVHSITLTGGPANDMAGITEVAMRFYQDFGGRKECQTKRLMLLM